MPIVRIALDVPLHTLFDYRATDDAAVGQYVRVSFRNQPMVGVVIEISDESDLVDARIKPVTQVLDRVPPVPLELLALLRFCSQYYHYPLGMTVHAALPARLRAGDAVAEPAYFALSERGQALDQEAFPKRQKVQRRILQALREGPASLAALRVLSPSAPAALKALTEAGWVEASAPAGLSPPSALKDAHALNDEQQQAVDAIAESQGFQCFLLFGITGSGKTEIYMHLMHRVLQQGGQVLLLVPEINLTPQLEHYFQCRFPGTELVSLHSHLADGLRAKNWVQAMNGRARIVLGTRLAVFAPLPDLSMIIVDEEHDGSFKQQDGLRYSARDVAIFRASQKNVPIVLGSATPSLESFYNAQNGRYRLLRLSQRALAEAKLPAVRCIDTRNAILNDGLSDALMGAIETRLARGEQSLIFINRRGYAPVLMCTACGWMSGCRHCAGKLVLHLKERRLRCHHCGFEMRVPHACPDCGNADLLPVGTGTQRVEDALQERFPAARILRVDRDSTRNKGTWSAMRRKIHEQAVDILVGTQMLAKGHDFKNLTLVGVLNPDGGLYSSDFRASEKLYAQLAQVSGRAGRGEKPGEVLIQTAFPDHPLFRALHDHDFEAYAKSLLEERKSAGFPPFVHQALLRAEGKEEADVYAFLNKARALGAALGLPADIYGVVPATMPRRANHFLAQLLVQHESRKALQQFLNAWEPQLFELPARKLRWSLDVDPMEF